MSHIGVHNVVCFNEAEDDRKWINLIENNLHLRKAAPAKTQSKCEDSPTILRYYIRDRMLVLVVADDEVYTWLLYQLFDRRIFPVKFTATSVAFQIVHRRKPVRCIKKRDVSRTVEYFPFDYVNKRYLPYAGAAKLGWGSDSPNKDNWHREKSLRHSSLKDVKIFRLMSFDMETRPSDATPVMVCLTEIDLSNENEISLVHEELGQDCHIRFFIFVQRLAMTMKKGSLVVILGFNSSRFDNVFLAAAMSHKVNSQIHYNYLEANGRIIDLSIYAKNAGQVYFRDVLLYFPVGSRGKLKTMAENFKLDHQKGECSLAEMQLVADALLDGVSDGNDDGSVNDSIKKELEYCRQDTRVLYGLARHIGSILLSMDGPRRYFLEVNPEIIPSVYAFLVWFVTLPQTAMSFLPWIFPDKSFKNFYSVSELGAARFIKTSIYGGRTLCGSIGQIVRNLRSTDICSEYPCAMNGPMPYGAPFYARLGWVNEMNVFLRDDVLFSNDFAFTQRSRPFVAYVSFSKSRNYLATHSIAGEHVPDQVLPFVPYRYMNDDFILDPYNKKMPGGLEWLADTKGRTLYGVYNSIDIYLMRRLGFRVQISTRFRPIVWPEWSYQLAEVFNYLYSLKASAKRAGDKKLELFCKIMLNSTIGKFAQRMSPRSEFDGVTFRVGKIPRNKILYQLNSYCMSYSRLINQGHQSVVCKLNHRPDYSWTNSLDCFKNIPVYCDTDNLIFVSPNVHELYKYLRDKSLLPNPRLCSFNADGMFFNMTLEFEEWHSCPIAREYEHIPPSSTALFLGKKSYIMRCDACGAIRLKAKGHNQLGIKTVDMAQLLIGDRFPLNFLIPKNRQVDALEITRRLFQTIYPQIDHDAAIHLTSGSRFTFKISLAKAGKISIEPSNIDRRYRAFCPLSQEFCPQCYRIVHK